MRATLALVKQHLKEQRLSTAVWAGMLALLSYMVVSIAPAVTADSYLLELLQNVSPSMAKLYGNLFAYKFPVDAFLQFKWMLFIPVLTMVYGVLAAMAIVAREVDQHSADFALTLPITRTRLLLSRFGALTLNVALLYFTSWAAIWVGLRVAAIQASFVEYAYFYIGQFFITLTLAAFTLWFSVLVAEYALAVRVTLVTGVTLWTLQLTSRTLGGPLWLERLLLFGWVQTEPVIAQGLFPWGAVAVGSALTAFFLTMAARVFQHKQVVA